ncbi:peptidoglycan DD-metalloendopeptidase family protein [Caldalkalibacillus horti]|uniref:Stage IV sporulation protein FA n=1 Tax=Caldalkalibacillus horti TaxID=77523 RepID=A0ABT9VTI7_9BACI|nr:peptidoglycan DD-metalloendopeptidase family protein [Bacillus horti]MDQ0164283.1 stage IV sporulation protein FA [Bacillus horti]
MDMETYKEGVKKRREERMRLLRRKQRYEAPPTSQLPMRKKDKNEAFYGMMVGSDLEQREDTGLFSLWIYKLMITLVIIGGTYFIMSSTSPELANSQDFIQDVFHREFNVEGVMAWYENRTGETLSFLPKLINRTNSDEQGYGVPVSGGHVVSGFGQDQQGIIVGTHTELPIEVIKEGYVTSVQDIQGIGATVVIDHGDGEESWYGQLQNIQVQPNDWLEQGHIIGYTRISEENGQGVFYFALRKDREFVDPVEVIPFD